MRSFTLLSAAWAVFALALVAQQANQANDKQTQDKQNKDKQANQPAPLFGGQIGTKSSQNTKESATLGFNGIDPSGKVEAKALGTTPSSSDVEKVRNMETTRPTQPEVVAFVKQGGLKSK